MLFCHLLHAKQVCFPTTVIDTLKTPIRVLTQTILLLLLFPTLIRKMFASTKPPPFYVLIRMNPAIRHHISIGSNIQTVLSLACSPCLLLSHTLSRRLLRLLAASLSLPATHTLLLYALLILLHTATHLPLLLALTLPPPLPSQLCTILLLSHINPGRHPLKPTLLILIVILRRLILLSLFSLLLLLSLILCRLLLLPLLAPLILLTLLRILTRTPISLLLPPLPLILLNRTITLSQHTLVTPLPHTQSLPLPL